MIVDTSAIVAIVRGGANAERYAEKLATVVPVTAVQAEIARAAYRDFGRGSAHPARLNFGEGVRR